MKPCRLIYRSVSVSKVVSNKTLLDLERKSSERNAKEDITGLLVLSGNIFLQVLEGSSQAVTGLFGRIISDKRHRQVELVSFESGIERYFDDWNMRLVDLDDLPGEKRTLMAKKYVGKGGEISVPADLHRVYAFLFDAKHVCLSAPWNLTSDTHVPDDEAAG